MRWRPSGVFGQFVVVLVAATLGVAQLRQLHRQNELQATIPCLVYTRTTEFNTGFRIVRDEVLGKTDDVELKAALAAADAAHPRVIAVFNLANFFTKRGVLVQERMIDVDTVVPYKAAGRCHRACGPHSTAASRKPRRSKCDKRPNREHMNLSETSHPASSSPAMGK